MHPNFQKFKNTNEIDSWYTKFQSAFPSDNSTDKGFIDAITNYTGSLNNIINNHLRYHKPIDSIHLPHLETMITKLPTYHIPDDIIVYRYISKGLLKEMCPSYPPETGMILQDKGFMSTTLLKSSVTPYREGRNQNILLTISVPSGTKGTYVGHLESTLSEYEVILAHNTKLRIDCKIPFCDCNIKCTVINES